MKTWQAWIDTGGTFTDCICISPEGIVFRKKVLSNSSLRGLIFEKISSRTIRISENWNILPALLEDYTLRLIESQFESKIIAYSKDQNAFVLDRDLPPENTLPLKCEILSPEVAPVFALRLITQTKLAEDLPPLILRLGSTKGTNALLEQKGAPVVFITNEGFEDLTLIGDQQRPDIFAREIIKPKALFQTSLGISGRLDASGKELEPFDGFKLESEAKKLIESGINSAAVAFIHSYLNPEYEIIAGKILRKAGFQFLSLSSELAPLIKLLPRSETAIVNAYLAPVLESYLDGISESLGNSQLRIMTSAGGLISRKAFKPKDSLLSGPAGGVVGAATIGRAMGAGKIISFDMGGTSTDVSRIEEKFDYRYEVRIGHARLYSPALNIETVAAGGGSICSYDGYQLKVGPESAGAYPGPACYGAGGPLTVTDVHLLLGRLDSALFSIPLYPEQAEKKLADILIEAGRDLDRESLLKGFLDITNELMAAAIRKVSISKGYDPGDFTMVAFGGAGGMHACALAEILGMEDIIIPFDGGLLSAFGIGNARVERIAEKQILQNLDDFEESLSGNFKDLSTRAIRQLEEEGIEKKEIVVREKLVFLRLKGQENSISIPFGKDSGKLRSQFQKAYKKLYGHLPDTAKMEIESIRLMASTRENSITEMKTPEVHEYIFSGEDKNLVGGNHQISIPHIKLNSLKIGDHFSGPALILDAHQSIFLEPEWELTCWEGQNLKLERKSSAEKRMPLRQSAADLELYSHRFMAIAQNMGALLQRTALSVNIKERLDFSCAIIDPEGELIANAPHIPVHLGSLSVCVRLLKANFNLEPGDVIVTNHPGYGGSHLPDVTLVRPVFSLSGNVIGYAASRAHHAEIGGSRPGSMPPAAKTLIEEGVIIEPFHLLKKGVPDWEGMKSILSSGPFPSRMIEDNLADLQAGLASVLHGDRELLNLVKKSGEETVLHFMKMIKENAAEKLKAKFESWGQKSFSATHKMDDGTPLSVKIETGNGRCIIDFGGSGSTHAGNLNANPAIVRSVVVYVLRLLLDEPVPLNEGLLHPVDILIPEGILNPVFPEDPRDCPAVVGGNTETSQRLTNLLLEAFGIMAGSQGTMNNVLFGNSKFGYYETIGGGGGAGSDFHGASAVHHHMTNTRITDPEILEFRYPVRLLEFAIRKDSGGKGRFFGGDGIIRRIQFLETVELSILSQHRKSGPAGLEGGTSGLPGEQWIIHPDGRKILLESQAQANVDAGDVLLIKTPGGGGWGKSK